MARRLDRLRRKYEPLLRRFFHIYFLLHRGMTLGVRAVVLDANNRVFLVKHSYVAGWYLPGGGVDHGETMEAAMRRELKEEGDIDLTGDAELHGIFFNEHVSRRETWALRKMPCSTASPVRSMSPSSFNSRRIASAMVSPMSTPPPGRYQPVT